MATFQLKWDFRLTPTVRHQSGSPFGRTFTQTLNWGNATVRAEPIDAQRTPNVTVLDVRTEKAFRAGPGRVTAFFDVYNMFNTNAEQELTTTAGASWLRPVAITAPRIARLGVRFAW